VDRLEMVDSRSYRIRVPPLALQLMSYERRRPAERAESIRSAMSD
jgi:hypothetical protein